MTQDLNTDVSPAQQEPSPAVESATAPAASAPAGHDPMAAPVGAEGPTAQFRRRGAPVWILAIVCVMLGLAVSWIGQQRQQNRRLSDQLVDQDVQINLLQAHINEKSRLLADPRTHMTQIFDSSSRTLRATVFWNAQTRQGLILPSPSDSLANPPVQYRLMASIIGSNTPVELQRFESDYNCVGTFFQAGSDLDEPAHFILEPVNKVPVEQLATPSAGKS